MPIIVPCSLNVLKHGSVYTGTNVSESNLSRRHLYTKEPGLRPWLVLARVQPLFPPSNVRRVLVDQHSLHIP